MVVMKFGGTSVRDEVWIDKVLDIVEKELDRAPVLIASAMGKITDRLVEIADFSSIGEIEKAYEVFQGVYDHHINTSEKFLTGDNLEACRERVTRILDNLKSIIRGLSLLKECSARSNDMILSFGERLSTTLIHHRALERGMKSFFLDSRDFMKTDDNFGSASLLEELTYDNIKKQILPEKGKLVVAQGFIASTREGVTSTLGRGGSDYSAAIIGSALGAEEIQIWTDVDGIMSCDPRVVPQAGTIPVVSYQEAAELAYFGARVLHPSTIQPATSQGIPVLVKNTGNPASPGTKIVPRGEETGPKAIAFKKGITVINISSSRMLLAYGFLRKIFEIFEKYKTPVDLIATSEVSVSVTIDNTDQLERIEKDLELVGKTSVDRENSIICLVGQDLWMAPSFVARVFNVLKDIPVGMISMGASETNISFVVPRGCTEEAVQKVHKELFE